MFFLTVIRGVITNSTGQKISDFHLNSEIITIGRASNNDIVVKNKKVSRYHAAIIRLSGTGNQGERHFIRDLGSLHFTRVNGRIVSRRLLENGDLIQIEDIELSYKKGRTDVVEPCPIEIIEGPAVSEPFHPESPHQIEACFSHNSTEYQHELHQTYLKSLPFSRHQAVCDFLTEIQRQETLPNLLTKSLEMLAELLEARHGFIALFSKDYHISDYTILGGAARFQVERPIVAHLLQGKFFCHFSILAFPIRTAAGVSGFVYLIGDFTKVMEKPDIEYYNCLGELLGKRIEEINSNTMLQKEKQEIEEIFAWPVTLIAKSKKMADIWSQLERIAPVEIDVLILGESGTGKELIAREIHRLSGRAGNPYIVVDCTKLHDATRAQSDLFGHVKGAYTGAVRDHKGAFVLADKGTIFLDEIGELKSDVQSALLRVFNDREIQPLGTNIPIKVDVRILSATNRDLRALSKEGNFREDLRYRLEKGVIIKIPPLRERKEDIPLLTHFFVDNYAKKLKKNIKGVSHGAVRLLMTYAWPGNIRELEGVIFKAIAQAPPHKEFLCVWDLPQEIREAGMVQEKTGKDFKTLKELEREEILAILRANHGNISKSAMVLGIPRQTLYRKIKKYGLKV